MVKVTLKIIVNFGDQIFFFFTLLFSGQMGFKLPEVVLNYFNAVDDDLGFVVLVDYFSSKERVHYLT